MDWQYLRVKPPDPRVSRFSKRLLPAYELESTATATQSTTASRTASPAQPKDERSDSVDEEEAEMMADLFEDLDDACIEKSMTMTDDFDEGADSDLARSSYPT